MKNKITKLGSALVLAVIVIILSTTGSNQAKADPKHQVKHDVVVLKTQEMGVGSNDTNGYVYRLTGIYIENSSSSKDAITFRRGSIPVEHELTQVADGIAQLLDAGYERVPDPKYMVFVKLR